MRREHINSRLNITAFLDEKLEKSDLVSVSRRYGQLPQLIVKTEDFRVDQDKRVFGHLDREVGLLFAVVLKIDLFALHDDHDFPVYVHLVKYNDLCSVFSRESDRAS